MLTPQRAPDAGVNGRHLGERSLHAGNDALSKRQKWNALVLQLAARRRRRESAPRASEVVLGNGRRPPVV